MPDTAALRASIIREARARLGIPYGLPPGPGETDCSLYVRDVYEAAGLPFSPGVRVAEQERQDTIPIDGSDVLPGDLLFFEGTYDAGPPSSDGHIASHVGISLGAGTHRMLNAVEPVSTETDISTPYWQAHIFEARRHPSLATAAPLPVGQLPRGIDVASYQGNPDWSAVAASGIAFAFTKITEDDDYQNPTFARNWSEIKAAGLVRGAYHFARPDGPTDAVEEADFFLGRLASVGGVQAGDILALDLEAGSGDLGRWALDWLHHVEQRAGVRPLVYTGAWFSGPHNLAAYPELGTYALWLASYQDAMPAPPAPWTSISIWQHDDKGRLSGIAGDVDLNVFNGTLDELKALGKGGTVAPPGSPLDPWRGVVGDGILTLMAADNTVPIMASTWLPLGRGQADAEAEEGYGANGTRYLWHLPSSRHWRYPAA